MGHIWHHMYPHRRKAEEIRQTHKGVAMWRQRQRWSDVAYSANASEKIEKPEIDYIVEPLGGVGVGDMILFLHFDFVLLASRIVRI